MQASITSQLVKFFLQRKTQLLINFVLFNDIIIVIDTLLKTIIVIESFLSIDDFLFLKFIFGNITSR